MKRLLSKKSMGEGLESAVDKLSLAVIAGLAGFSFVIVILLLIGQFRAQLIWTLAPIVAIFCAWIVYKFGRTDRPGSSRERLICDLIVIFGVLVWGSYNIFFTSQHVLTNRDPAIYANAASWLSEKNDLKIVAPNTLKGVEGVSPGFDNTGFSVDRDKGDVVYVQGQHLLPSLLGAIGKFVGVKNVLHFNILFGMTALLAIYCFARLFIRPYWAAVGAGVMAGAMPMLYFSRDVYTEPLTATFIFGGLALIWIAQKNNRLALWALAGLVVGASVLTRIDSYLSLIGFAAFLSVYAAFSKKPSLKRRLMNVLFFALPATVMCFLAWLDLVLLSKNYYIDTQSLITQEIMALFAVICLGLVVNIVIFMRPDLLIWLDKKTIKWRAKAGALLVLFVGLALMVRPILTGVLDLIHWSSPASAQQQSMTAYTDITTSWVSWYIGPVLACLGLIGLAYALYKSMNNKNLILLCGLFVILGTSVVYFIKPSIWQDQIWASRRMLPVIMPGIAVFGVYMLSIITEKINFPSAGFKNSLIIIACLGIISTPVITSKPLMVTRDTAEYAFIPELCPSLPSNATVVWTGVGRMVAVQPTRGYCHVESYGYLLNGSEKPTIDKLAEIAKATRSHGRVPIIGIINNQENILADIGSRGNLTQVVNLTYSVLESTFTTPPQSVGEVKLSASIAIINNNGSLRQIINR